MSNPADADPSFKTTAYVMDQVRDLQAIMSKVCAERDSAIKGEVYLAHEVARLSVNLADDWDGGSPMKLNPSRDPDPAPVHSMPKEGYVEKSYKAEIGELKQAITCLEGDLRASGEMIEFQRRHKLKAREEREALREQLVALLKAIEGEDTHE